MPFGRALDILISTNGEESSYTGGVFIAGEIKMIPINQNGLGGSNENGGIILFSVSAKDQATLSSSSVWSNKIAGNKLLDNVSVSKYNNGGRNYTSGKLRNSNHLASHIAYNHNLSGHDALL